MLHLRDKAASTISSERTNVVSTDVAHCLLQAKEIGQTKYEEFVKEKLEGKRSIWDTIKKEKIAALVSNNKGFTVTVNNETYQIKEERKLLFFRKKKKKKKRKLLNRVLVVS